MELQLSIGSSAKPGEHSSNIQGVFVERDHFTDAMEGQRFSRLGLSIIACLGFAVLVLNIFFWWRYVHAAGLWGDLEDGSCKLLSEKYTAGWKWGWSFPITGPSWTDVPCNVKLEASLDGEPGFEGKATLHFTYWQGVVWDYLKDSCSRMLPKLDGSFDCAFDLQGTVFVGHTGSLPHLPRLLLMKASGLSLLTLSPVLLMCVNMGRAARASEISMEVQADEPYTVLTEDPDGI